MLNILKPRVGWLPALCKDRINDRLHVVNTARNARHQNHDSCSIRRVHLALSYYTAAKQCPQVSSQRPCNMLVSDCCAGLCTSVSIAEGHRCAACGVSCEESSCADLAAPPSVRVAKQTSMINNLATYPKGRENRLALPSIHGSSIAQPELTREQRQIDHIADIACSARPSPAHADAALAAAQGAGPQEKGSSRTAR